MKENEETPAEELSGVDPRLEPYTSQKITNVSFKKKPTFPLLCEHTKNVITAITKPNMHITLCACYMATAFEMYVR